MRGYFMLVKSSRSIGGVCSPPMLVSAMPAPATVLLRRIVAYTPPSATISTMRSPPNHWIPAAPVLAKVSLMVAFSGSACLSVVLSASPVIAFASSFLSTLAVFALSAGLLPASFDLSTLFALSWVRACPRCVSAPAGLPLSAARPSCSELVPAGVTVTGTSRNVFVPLCSATIPILCAPVASFGGVSVTVPFGSTVAAHVLGMEL